MADKKSTSILGGLLDLIILVLLVGGAGYFGYITGLNQRLAPVQLVPPGTVGALLHENQPKDDKPAPLTGAPAQATQSPADTNSSNSSEQDKSQATNQHTGKTKYWLVSSGEEYIGSSITAKINGETVDIFFGPGKSIDITRKVKKGKNTLEFDCKALDEGYNKHPGDASFGLTVKLVSGPTIRDDFAPSAVLFACHRTAKDTKDATDTKTFTAKE